MQNKSFYLIIILLSFIVLFNLSNCAGQHFYFNRDIYCIDQNNKGYCDKWNQTTVLYRYTDILYYCFPGDAYVLSQKGPIQMKNLQLQDQIFAMNLQTLKNQFVQVMAWLHHDPTSFVQYRQIRIKNSQQVFLSSDYHNIAFYNQTQTNFKFLKDFKENDILVSLSLKAEQLKVQNIDNKIQKQGLYSPFTQTGTFYIFPQNFDLQTYNKNNDEYSMILVHSLSQIHNPLQNFNKAYNFIKISSYVLPPYQPFQDQEYVNPLISTFRMTFLNDWVNVQGAKIQQKINNQNGHIRSSYTSSSSSSARQRQQERKRKTIAILGLGTINKDVML